MEANLNGDPWIVVEGLEDILERDLKKAKVILEQKQNELLAFKHARSHEVARKRNWKNRAKEKSERNPNKLKFDPDAMQTAFDQCNVNIRHMQDKIEATEAEIEHYTKIVDTLTEQLREQQLGLAMLAKWRRENEEDADTG